MNTMNRTMMIVALLGAYLLLGPIWITISPWGGKNVIDLWQVRFGVCGWMTGENYAFQLEDRRETRLVVEPQGAMVTGINFVLYSAGLLAIDKIRRNRWKRNS